jgi:hypothetical protein
MLASREAAIAQMGLVRGIVREDTADKGSYTLVRLIREDSTVVKTTITDTMGAYRIYVNGSGTFHVRVDRTGYRSYYSPLIRIDSSDRARMVVLDTVALEKDITALASVEVVGRKKFIEHKFNKTVINVENSVFAQGNSLLELLPILPGVKADPSGGIQVRGKSNILFLIDGKGQMVPKDQVNELLRNINGATIEKIEITENPSARYDATVQAVINVITIKAKVKSDVHAAFGSQLYPARDEPGFSDNTINVGTNVNTKVGEVKLRANLDYRKNAAFEKNTEQIAFLREQPVLLRDQSSIKHTDNASLNLNLGLNYDVSTRQFLDVLVNSNHYFFSRNNNDTRIDLLQPKASAADSGILISGRNANKHFYTDAVNAKYVAGFGKKGQELAFYLDYNDFSFSRTGNYDNRVFYSEPPKQIDSSFSTDWDYDVRITSLKSDYTYPLNDKLFLDAGAKLSLVHNISNFRENKTANDFTYKETVSAAYVSVRNTSDKWKYELGFRVENTHSQGEVADLSGMVKRDYLNYFPTVTSQWTIDERNSISLSFRSTMVRPTYADFNPTRIVYLPYYSLTGDINLNPKITRTVELGYSFKDYTLTFSNIYSTNVRGSMPDSLSGAYNISNKIFSYSYINTAAAELDAPLKICRIWTSNNSISGYLISSGLPDGSSKHYWSFDLSTNHNLALSRTLNASFILTYSYYNEQGYDRYKPILNTMLSVQKTLGSRIILNLSANDLLGAARLQTFRDYGYLSMDSRVINNSRSFRLSVRYRFNSGTLFSSKDRRSKDTNNEIRF